MREDIRRLGLPYNWPVIVFGWYIFSRRSEINRLFGAGDPPLLIGYVISICRSEVGVQVMCDS